MDKAGILKQTDLFYNLTPEQLQLIANLASERCVQQHQVVFEEGSNSRDVYVVVSGSVEISHRNYRNDNKDTGPVVLATLTSGQSFGEIAFIDKAVREATVTSLQDDTQLLVIDADALMSACELDPALGFYIIRNIARDLAFIIREMDVHVLGELYWNTPFGVSEGGFESGIE